MENDVLTKSGYNISDFSDPAYRQNVIFVAAGFLTGRIRSLADYLEQVNTGKAVILSTSGEDNFSKLEDEIYKTVTFLYQTRDTAVQAKNDFAENLSNIAHQIKTPITAISLSVQTMQKEYG